MREMLRPARVSRQVGGGARRLWVVMAPFVTFSMEIKSNSAREAIVFIQETGKLQVWEAGKPEKEMAFYKGFSSTLTA